jgi:hypothetical protein
MGIRAACGVLRGCGRVDDAAGYAILEEQQAASHEAAKRTSRAVVTVSLRGSRVVDG